MNDRVAIEQIDWCVHEDDGPWQHIYGLPSSEWDRFELLTVAQWEGRRLGELRQAAGLTHETLAAAIGGNPADIAAYERGDKMPDDADRAAVAAVLGCPPAVFTLQTDQKVTGGDPRVVAFRQNAM